ncbi:melanocortin receptor 5-like [Dendronephthya gigantea]|uniref:melanocortin receptor 5-like n=1 Tax=Dendronephthya gigantea TaxID=151771 RepID=UPI00106D6556|nr:melanocortin receptor 5-like [Dendronephthya gigantea]
MALANITCTTTGYDNTNETGITPPGITSNELLNWANFIAFIKKLDLTMKVILIVIIIFTTLGNTLVLIATWRERGLHQPNKYFIACLAVADFLSKGILATGLCPHYFQEYNRIYERQIMLRNGELGQTSANLSKQTATLRHDMKVFRMLVIIMGVFIVCWSPWFIGFVLLNNFIDLNCLFYKSNSYWYRNYTIFFVANTLPLLNSLCNPIIYAWLDQKYREAFKNLFKQVICRFGTRMR